MRHGIIHGIKPIDQVSLILLDLFKAGRLQEEVNQQGDYSNEKLITCFF